jgi:hypothetical protein
MIVHLKELSSLRLALNQQTKLADTIHGRAIDAELQGEPFKALELLSETHHAMLKVKELEESVAEKKSQICKLQAQRNANPRPGFSSVQSTT